MQDMLTTLLPFVAIVAIFYLLMIRPQQKKVREQQERVAKLEPGTRVMLASGIFATIRYVGDKQAVVEISPGIEMTIVKNAIAKVVGPSDEEFEYDDEGGEQSEDDPAEAVAQDDGFDQAIAGFDAPSAPDPQSDDGLSDDARPGESK